MKLTSLFAAAAAGLFLSSVSCERHSWEDTKKLHEKHGHAEHSAEHAGPEAHGDEHHAEEKAH